MSFSRYGVAVVALLALFLFSSSAFAQAVPPSSNQQLVFLDRLPPEIRDLVQRDPNTLTEEENKKVGDFIFKNNSPFSSGGAGSSSLRGTTNCFDYYHFGSVQVDLSPTLPHTVPGVALSFDGEVRNTNSYPIVDGQVYVKIFREAKDGKFNGDNGPALVDQFPLKETFVLPAHGVKKTSFSWTVPDNAPAGEYRAAFFFETARRFNLLGLSFTDDVTGNGARFSVTSKNKDVVAFDKNTVTLNDKLHRFAVFSLHFAKDEPVTVVAKLVNPRNETVTVPVTWKLYSWDGLRKEMLKDTKEESVQLKPKETKNISYVAVPINSTISYLVAETADAASKSILDIRFTRDGIDDTRINFPSITAYPLEAGKENTLFSCLHSTNLPVVSDNTLTLTLRDATENIIHTYTYSGDVTSAMMGVKDTFTPRKTYSTFSLTATLTHKGDIVDEVRETYDCQTIDPALCPQPSAGPSIDFFSGPVLTAGITILLLLLALLGWKIARNRKEGVGFSPTTLALLILVSSAIFIGAPDKVEAKTLTTTQQYANLSASISSIQMYATMIFHVNAYAYDPLTSGYTRLLSDGDSIPSNGTFKVVLESGSGSYGTPDVSWFGIGGGYDSPFGNWVQNVSGSVLANNFCGGASGESACLFIGDVSQPVGGNVRWRAKVTFNSSVPTFTTTGATCSLSGSSGDEILCSVTTPQGGTIRVTPTYSGTVIYRVGAKWNVTGINYPGYADVPLDTPASFPLFSFTSGSPTNMPPTTPSVALVSAPYASTPVSFTAQATDPDGDPIRYSVDWDNDGIIDEYIPSSGYVPSGTVQTFTHTWPLGIYNFKVRAQDTGGLSSPPNTFNVNVVSPPTPMFINLTATPSVVYVTSPTSVLKWDSNADIFCNFDPPPPTVPPQILNTGGATTNLTGITVNNIISPSETFTIRCTRNLAVPPWSEEMTKSVSVTVVSSPTATLTASPTTVLTGGSSTLTWSSLGTTHCSGSGFSTGAGTPPSGTATVFPASPSTTYTLNCDNGAPPQDVTVAVDQTPGVTLTATPPAYITGGNSKLTWTSVNATSCSGSGFSTGPAGPLQLNNPTTGVTVNPSTTTIYSITCRRAGYPDAVSNATVTVFPSANVTLTATPSSIESGASSLLTWVSAGMASCTSPLFATGGATSNSTGVPVSPTMSQAYDIDCTKSVGGSHMHSNVFVTVGPAVTFWADPDTINNGDSTHLKWDSPTADYCDSMGFPTGSAKSNSTTGVAVSPASTTTYGITCTDTYGGETTKNATVTVNSVAAVVSITANPARVKKGGGTSTITWSSNINGCNVYGPGLSSIFKTGSQAVSVTTQSTYSIYCGTTLKSVTVNVGAGFGEF